MRTFDLGGSSVPVIGQGTWHMGENPAQLKEEVAALRLGIDLGMTLIDTAEMYAEGEAERVVGEAIAGRRDSVYVVTKVYPHNSSRKGLPAACDRSLQRLGTDYIDLYLLHWPGQYPLDETAEAFERLREAGKIGRWGVSNFDVSDMLELNNPACATNQVLYNIEQRGVEFDLLPWTQTNLMPLMAYCPVAQGGRLLKHPVLRDIAARHHATPAQVCLAWVLRNPGVIAIPKAVDPEHLRLNAGAAQLVLTDEDLTAIEETWPAPLRKQHLAMV